MAGPTLTHDPLWLGVVVAAQFLPILIFGLFAGVLADTLPKRQTLHRDAGREDGPLHDPGGARRDRERQRSRF